MKIAIINLTGGGISGGYKKYLLNIIPRLAASADVESLLCVSPGSLGVEKWFDPMQNVEFANCPPYNLFGYRFNTGLRRKIDQFMPDLIFIPVERPVKLSKNIPVVTMIQNMECFTPDIDRFSLAGKMKCWLQKTTGKKAVNNAARVIAISGFVRDFLINTWHIPNDKIGLAYYGLSFDKNKVYAKPENIPLDWNENFLFTAGSIRPARGLEDLILAAKSLNFDFLGIKGIVIAGETVPEMLKYKQRLLDLIKVNNLMTRFIFLDKINPPQMEWCYRNCQIFVMTSRVESFGMIGLEAMANGCLCVVADNPCLPEIFGGCASYYRPKDAVDLAGAINLTLKFEDSRKQEMSRQARVFAAKFSWDKTVDILIKEFNKAVEAPIL